MVGTATPTARVRPTIKAIIFDWGRTLYDSDTAALFPDATGIVDHLARSYSLAIVALIARGDFEAGVRERYHILRDAKLMPHFAAILFDREDKDRLYARALDGLHLRATDVAIVDDRMHRGIRWGNQHGATTIWLRRGKFRDECPTADTGQPTHTIQALTELREML